MSAPDTNIDKQEKQHKPALLGVKGAMIFGIVVGTYSSICVASPLLLYTNVAARARSAADESTEGTAEAS